MPTNFIKSFHSRQHVYDSKIKSLKASLLRAQFSTNRQNKTTFTDRWDFVLVNKTSAGL